MPHHDNGNNLSTEEQIVVSQDFPKLLGLPVTCGNERGRPISIRYHFLTPKLPALYLTNQVKYLSR